MNRNINISEILQIIQEGANTPSTWLQFAVLGCAFAIAWFLHRYWAKHLAISKPERTRLHRLTIGTGQRLVLPFTMLILVLTARAIAQAVKYPTVLLDIAVPLLLSLAAIRFAIYVLHKAYAPTAVLKAWENTIATVIWLGVALHLLGWLPDILTAMDDVGVSIGESRISLLWALKLIVSMAFFLLLALWLSAILEKRVSRSKSLSIGLKVGLTKSSRVLLVTIGFLIALNSIGINLSALTIFGGALGVGLGFGLQRIASNFVSGFILLFDRSIRPGDVISIGNSFGWVQELRARYVVVRDRDGVETLIPNENLITSEVINWSYSDQVVRLKIPVQISYDDDPKKAMALMLEASKASKRVLNNPEPVCRLMSFGDSGIDLELRVWLSDPEQGLTNIRSEINLAVWYAFKDNQITIPFPQRDVHMIDPSIKQTSA